MPAAFEIADVSPDHAHHAWVEYIGDTYPLFLASEDFEMSSSQELANFHERVGE